MAHVTHAIGLNGPYMGRIGEDPAPSAARELLDIEGAYQMRVLGLHGFDTRGLTADRAALAGRSALLAEIAHDAQMRLLGTDGSGRTRRPANASSLIKATVLAAREAMHRGRCDDLVECGASRILGEIGLMPAPVLLSRAAIVLGRDIDIHFTSTQTAGQKLDGEATIHWVLTPEPPRPWALMTFGESQIDDAWALASASVDAAARQWTQKGQGLLNGILQVSASTVLDPNANLSQMLVVPAHHNHHAGAPLEMEPGST